MNSKNLFDAPGFNDSMDLNVLMTITQDASIENSSEPDMYRIRIMFPNGYGASIVKGTCTSGSVEVAVIDFNGHIISNTPITDDVIQDVPSLKELNKILKDIKELPIRK